MNQKIKYILYSLIPAIVLFGSVELCFRLFFSVKPAFITAPLPDQLRGLAQPHPDLFWVMIPNAVVREPNGVQVRINAQGFRGPDLKAKVPGDFRILSLGESTTFGAGVEQDATYSALLEQALNRQMGHQRNFQVLNCGFSAYSSFQGLKYLELYGLGYQPDMVLLYFEINDYMPSTLRHYGLDETHADLTDAQLYDSNGNSVIRRIINSSMFLTYLHYRYAAAKVKTMGSDEARNPFINIGIQNPSYTAGRLAIEKEGRLVRTELNEYNLGQRVSEQERVSILKAFRNICQRLGIPMVVIHPTYLNSGLHRCVLTDFCKTNKIPLFEAYYSLHPDPVEFLFMDNLHPNPEGHRRLAHDLAEFLLPLLKR